MECKIPASWRRQLEEGTQVATLYSAPLPDKQLTTVPGMTAAAVAKDSGVKPL